jgi:peptidyl-prolyl cis-trans isomerase D
VLKRVEGGQTVAAALAAEKVALPAPDKVDMGREDLARQQRVPPVLALMFSMAKGTVKRLEGPDDSGWFVVRLDDVVVPEVDNDDPIIAAAQRQLVSVFSDEYSEQMVAAAMREVGVVKNQAAIDAVARQLTGRTE